MTAAGDANGARRLRVLHLGRFHNPQAFGGIERHVAALLGGLSSHVDADNLVAGGDAADVGAAIGYRIHRAPSFGTLAGVALAPTMPAMARRLDRAHRYDIVHLHFPDPLSQWVAQSLPRRIRRVVSWHSDIVRQQRALLLYRPLLNRFLRDVDAVVAATPFHFSCSTQMDEVPVERRHVIPYGLDYAAFEAADLPGRAAQLRAQAAPTAGLIFAVGRHVYYKGFETLIRAMASLPGTVLVLGGSGPLTDVLKQTARDAGVAGRVVFAGRLKEQDLAAWFHACDVFCMPSTERSEAFGLVQLEAMACGKPVVCARLGNGVNFVNQEGVTGLAAQPGDPADLANALRQLLNDPALRQSMGQQARNRAYREFSREAMVQKTLALYRRLVPE